MRKTYFSAVIALVAATGAQADVAKPVVLVTFDPPEDREVRMLSAGSIDDIRAQAKLLSLQVIEKDNSIWIVPLDFSRRREKEDFAAMCNTLLERLKSGGSLLKKAELDSRTRDTLDKHLAYWGGHFRDTARVGVMSGDLSFGFEVSQAMKLSIGDKTIVVRAPERSNLGANRVRNSWKEPTAEELERADALRSRLLGESDQVHNTDLLTMSFRFSAFPMKPGQRATIVKEISQFIADEFDASDKIAQQAEDSLLDAVLEKGISAFRDEIPPGTSFADVPQGLQSLMSHTVLDNYAAYGFASVSDAELFLARASVSAYGRDLQMAIPWQEGDRKGTISFPIGSNIGH